MCLQWRQIRGARGAHKAGGLQDVGSRMSKHCPGTSGGERRQAPRGGGGEGGGRAGGREGGKDDDVYGHHWLSWCFHASVC